jgi:hypothetical protein
MKKILFALLITVAAFKAQAQFNIHELGRKDIYFGIALGVNVADYKTQNHSPKIGTRKRFHTLL